MVRKSIEDFNYDFEAYVESFDFSKVIEDRLYESHAEIYGYNNRPDIDLEIQTEDESKRRIYKKEKTVNS